MRFILPFTLLSSLAVAKPVEKRSDAGVAAGIEVIKAVLDNLNGGILKTKRDIDAWKGNAPGIEIVFQDAGYLLNDIRQGATQVAASPTVSVWDRATWLKPAYDLDNNLEKLIAALIAKKNKFDANNRSSDVGGVLGNIKSSVDELVRVIFTKLPSVAQPLARPVSNQIVGKVERAMKTFSGTPKPVSGGLASASNADPWWAKAGASPPKASGPASNPSGPAWANSQLPAPAPAPQSAAPAWSNSQPPTTAPQSPTPAWSNSQPPASSPQSPGPAWANVQPPASAQAPAPVWAGGAGPQQSATQGSGWGS